MTNILMVRAGQGMVTFKFRSNNGEFKSAKWRKLIKSCAGQLVTNAPYSPEEVASIMLLIADPGEGFLEETTSYAVNIYNRIPLSKRDSKGLRISPYEKVYRERPIRSDLMPFGCRGYALLNIHDKNRRGRSQHVIFMGRDFNTIGGARFYHPPSQHFGNSGHVT